MGKVKNVLFTALFGTAAAASFLLGDDAYRKYIRENRERRGASAGDEETAQEEWEMDGLDNTKLYAALYLPDAEAETHDYILLLRDMESEPDSIQPLLSHYREKGMRVLVPDPRGCGKSTGRYLGYGYDDRLDVIGWIHRILHTDPKAKIALHGMGTGAAAALLAGAEYLPGAVYATIADSSYTTLTEYLQNRMRREEGTLLPAEIRLVFLRIVTRIKAGFDIGDASPLKAVEKTNVPTLFVHGDEDRVTPVDMSRTLYRRAGCTRQIGIYLGAGHLQSMTLCAERYFGQTDSFLAKQHPDRL